MQTFEELEQWLKQQTVLDKEPMQLLLNTLKLDTVQDGIVQAEHEQRFVLSKELQRVLPGIALIPMMAAVFDPYAKALNCRNKPLPRESLWFQALAMRLSSSLPLDMANLQELMRKEPLVYEQVLQVVGGRPRFKQSVALALCSSESRPEHYVPTKFALRGLVHMGIARMEGAHLVPEEPQWAEQRWQAFASDFPDVADRVWNALMSYRQHVGRPKSDDAAVMQYVMRVMEGKNVDHLHTMKLKYGHPKLDLFMEDVQFFGKTEKGAFHRGLRITPEDLKRKVDVFTKWSNDAELLGLLANHSELSDLHGLFKHTECENEREYEDSDIQAFWYPLVVAVAHHSRKPIDDAWNPVIAADFASKWPNDFPSMHQEIISRKKIQQMVRQSEDLWSRSLCKMMDLGFQFTNPKTSDTQKIDTLAKAPYPVNEAVAEKLLCWMIEDGNFDRPLGRAIVRLLEERDPGIMERAKSMVSTYEMLVDTKNDGYDTRTMARSILSAAPSPSVNMPDMALPEI